MAFLKRNGTYLVTGLLLATVAALAWLAHSPESIPAWNGVPYVPAVLLALATFCFWQVDQVRRHTIVSKDLARSEATKALELDVSHLRAELERERSAAGAQLNENTQKVSEHLKEIQGLQQLVQSWEQLLQESAVPIVTIDPNNDHIAYANAEGHQSGFALGEAFKSYVVPEDHDIYDSSNRVGGINSERRSYLARLNLPTVGVRWTAIRSVPIKGALPALQAREGDRLGIVVPLQIGEVEQLETSFQNLKVAQEREKLGSLITHALALPARVLADDDMRKDSVTERWLQGSLGKRVAVIAELLSGWGSSSPGGSESAVAKQAVFDYLDHLKRATGGIATLESHDLRNALHWNNGILSRLPKDMDALRFDLTAWDANYGVRTSMSWAVLFVLEELLVNAIKYSKERSQSPKVSARLTVVNGQKWVEFEIQNVVRSIEHVRPPCDPGRYGGTRLVAETCRRLGWQIDPPELNGELYKVTWRVPTLKLPPPPTEKTGGTSP